MLADDRQVESLDEEIVVGPDVVTTPPSLASAAALDGIRQGSPRKALNSRSGTLARFVRVHHA